LEKSVSSLSKLYKIKASESSKPKEDSMDHPTNITQHDGSVAVIIIVSVYILAEYILAD